MFFFCLLHRRSSHLFALWKTKSSLNRQSQHTLHTGLFSRSRLSQGHRYAYPTPDPVGVHHAPDIKQRLAADVMEDLMKFSFCHISKSLPPTCTDTEALITLSAMEEHRRSQCAGHESDGLQSFVMDLEQWCRRAPRSLNMVGPRPQHP